MKGRRLLNIALLLAAVMMLTLNAQAAVKINKTKVSMVKGQYLTLKVTGTSKTVKWSSDKKSVAAVSSKGKVTAKKAGKATITAKVGKKKLYCKVTVSKTIDVAKYRRKKYTALANAIGGLTPYQKSGNNSNPDLELIHYDSTKEYSFARMSKYVNNNVLVRGYWASKLAGPYVENTFNPNIYVYGTKILGQSQSTITKKLKAKGFSTTNYSTPGYDMNQLYDYWGLQLFLKSDEQISVGYNRNGKAVYFRYYPWGSNGTNG